MPDRRTHKSIASRLDLAMHRRSLPRLWVRRRVAMFWGGLITIVAVATAWAWAGNSIYQARPISKSHGLVENNCQACHGAGFQTLWRLVSMNESHRSVSDAACQTCHTQTASDHASAMPEATALRCAECHHEHQDWRRLSEVASARCVACHADLIRKEGWPAKTKSVTHFGAGAHGDFFHTEKLAATSQRAPTERQGARLVAQGEFRVWEDAGTLKFNHAKHLDREGVLMPWQAEVEGGLGRGIRKRLTCVDCHEADESGRGMRAIAYERHCAECHRLEYSSRLAPGGPLPHASPELVKGVLRDRLLAYVRTHREELKSPTKPAEGSDLPHKRTPTPEAIAKDEFEWVELQLAERGRHLFSAIANGCGYCHTARETAGDALAFGDVAPPAIVERWLPGARFSHDRHRQMACQDCHQAESSRVTGDILLPSIAVCQTCHDRKQPGAQSPIASGACVECHDYHHSAKLPGKSREPGTILKQLIGADRGGGR